MHRMQVEFRFNRNKDEKDYPIKRKICKFYNSF